MSDIKTYKAISPREGDRSEELASGTVRVDTAKKILRNSWVNGLVLDQRTTDDYKRDYANDFYSNMDVDPEDLIDEIETVQPKRIWVRQMDDGRQLVIFFWSYQSYTAELDTSVVKFTFGNVL